MKKLAFALVLALTISSMSMTAFAAGKTTTNANGDIVMSFSLGSGFSSKPAEPAQPSNGGGTSPTGEAYLTHDEIMQLGKEIAEEYGLEWHDGPKKTFDMSVSAIGTKEAYQTYFSNCYTSYVEAGYDSIYIEIFYDGNEYVVRIYR